MLTCRAWHTVYGDHIYCRIRWQCAYMKNWQKRCLCNVQNFLTVLVKKKALFLVNWLNFILVTIIKNNYCQGDAAAVRPPDYQPQLWPVQVDLRRCEFHTFYIVLPRLPLWFTSDILEIKNLTIYTLRSVLLLMVLRNWSYHFVITSCTVIHIFVAGDVAVGVASDGARVRRPLPQSDRAEHIDLQSPPAERQRPGHGEN